MYAHYLVKPSGKRMSRGVVSKRNITSLRVLIRDLRGYGNPSGMEQNCAGFPAGMQFYSVFNYYGATAARNICSELLKAVCSDFTDTDYDIFKIYLLH